MATLLGDNSKPTSTQEWTAGGTLNQQALSLAMPPGGPWRILTLGGWLAGQGADATVKLCVWTTDDVLQGESVSFTAIGRSFGVGQSDGYQADLLTPFGIAGGAGVLVGWSRNTSHSTQWGRYATGIHYDDSGAFPSSLSGKVEDAGGAISAWLFYELQNTAPHAPTNLSPTGGVLITGADLTPALSFLYTDPESNNSSAYQVQIDTWSNFPSPVWDSGKTSLVQAHNTTMIVSPTTSLARGTLYYWRARVWDSGDLVSGWSV